MAKKSGGATPSSAGGGGGGHTRRSAGLQQSSKANTGGGVTITPRQASTPKGSGQGKVTPLAAKAPPKSSAKVIGQSGRTVAGNSAMPGSSGGGRKIKSS